MLSALLPLLLSGPAHPFPDTDPEREVVVVGAAPTASQHRGAWDSASGLSLQSVEPARSLAYWISADPAHWIGDGFVRARVRLSGSPDFTVLVRASVDGDSDESLWGLGLSVDGDRMEWHRWERGVVRSTGVDTRLARGRRAELELALYLVGPQVVAVAYDPATLQAIGTLAVREPGLSGGAVGFRVNGRGDGGSVLTHLSVMADGAGWWSEHGLLDEPRPHGTDRLVLFPSAQLGRLPGPLRRRDLGPWPFDASDSRALLTDRDGVERLRRSGVEVGHVRGDIPQWAVSSSYRRWRGTPPVPTERGFRLDLGYKDAHMVADLLRAYADRYPQLARLHELGRSHRGQPVLGLRISDRPDRDEDEPAFLLVAAHHGSELLATEYALDAMARLLEGYGRDPEVTRWVDALDIWCVPLVNPDGNLVTMEHNRDAGRKNGRDTNGNGRFDTWEGVDLNRNYPFAWGALGESGSRSWQYSSYFRGEGPGSEPETRAIMALADSHRFVAALSFHTNGTVLLSPYTIDGVRNPEPDEAWTIAAEVVARLPTQPGNRTFRVIRKMYSVDGTDQDWLRHTHGTVAYILEGSHHNPGSAEVARASVVGVRPALTAMLQRVLDGPGVRGHVVDTQGTPVEAEVRIAEVRTRAGERWTSRPRDGRFDRLLPGPGTWTVVATDGARSARRTVTVEDGPVEVRLVLQGADPKGGAPDQVSH